MKYAIISDIHGNLPAFLAVLNDAEAQQVDKYLLLGDYTSGFPWGNDVVKAIRGLKSFVAVSGNGEGYLADIYKKGQTDFSDNQFKPVYWAYQSLSIDNLQYLISLPETIIADDNIHLAHTINMVHHKQVAEFFHPHGFHMMMKANPITHDEYLILARESLLSCSESMADILALPKGVYLFGHNHLQFHMEYDGRLFINPGSCGDAIDWDTNAPYTLLSCQDGCLTVTERRIEYDINAVANGLEISGFSDYSPMWSEIIRLGLFTAKNYFYLFVIHLIETGKSMGCNKYPVSNDVWNIAVKTWDASKV